MKILNHLKSGLSRSARSWKGIMIIWIFFLFLVALYALPLRCTLYSSFGKSMITERLASGFDLEAFTDLGPAFRSLISFLSGGFLLIVTAGFILNAFLTGGLFSSFREKTGRFSSSEFFRASARNFWPFLIILFIITLFVCLIGGLIIYVPLIIVRSAETLSEKNSFIIVFAAVLIVLFLLPVFLLIGDYSRAWMVTNEGGSCFKALGYGFNQTFRKFWSSYAVMLILVLVQILFGLLAVSILPSWRPVTGAGVLIMFIISQLIIYARLFLKSWRYASITTITETYRNIII